MLIYTCTIHFSNAQNHLELYFFVELYAMPFYRSTIAQSSAYECYSTVGYNKKKLQRARIVAGESKAPNWTQAKRVYKLLHSL